MSQEMNVNVDDILFDRLRREDYIRMRQRGMSLANIAEAFRKPKFAVSASVRAWGLREWEPGQPVPDKPKYQKPIKDNPVLKVDKRNDQLTEASNMVEHPPHYTAGGIECIDAIMAAVEGLTPQEAVCVANVLKYTWRFKRKNGKQDLEKAGWYLNRLKDLQGG